MSLPLNLKVIGLAGIGTTLNIEELKKNLVDIKASLLPQGLIPLSSLMLVLKDSSTTTFYQFHSGENVNEIEGALTFTDLKA